VVESGAMWPAYIAHRMLTVREEEPTNPDEPSGHVTSISVIRPYRRLGLANRLMKQSRELMVCGLRSRRDMRGIANAGRGRRRCDCGSSGQDAGAV
jgi:ribosomal protein S18 acetylase RimI-like enzyme